MLKSIAKLLLALWVSFHWSAHGQQSSLYGGHASTPMVIDIKPDDADNIVSPSTSRVIKVAIFGETTLDVMEINPRTIRLRAVDAMLVGKSNKRLCQPLDLNKDGLLDLLCDINTTGFRVGEGEFVLVVRAATYQGESLQGEDTIKVVLNSN